MYLGMGGKGSLANPSDMYAVRKDFGSVFRAGGLHNPVLAEGILAGSKKAAKRAVTLSGK